MPSREAKRVVRQESLQEIAKSKGGVILSPYVGSGIPVMCRCAAGHQWPMKPSRLKQGRWCRACAAKKNAIKSRHGIVKMRAVAEQRGGTCLSEEYSRAHSHLEWKCSNGHLFRMTPAHVLAGHWCKRCATQRTADRLRGSLVDYKKLAADRNGECLSEKYVNAQTLLLWRCDKGHKWFAAPYSIKAGNWCQKCHIERMVANRTHNRALGIEVFQRLATAHGGECISVDYKNSSSRLAFRCRRGHCFETSASNVRNGNWCMTCGMIEGAENRRMPIHEIREIARSRGGDLLSTEYKSGNQKLEWRCGNGHVWVALLSKVKIGQWCPNCSAGLGERICRSFFEQLFETRFPSVWPKWLRNERGRGMQLDGYSQKLSVAFEHHGRQHYEITKLMAENPLRLSRRQKDDAVKAFLCEEHGVKLLVIPEIPSLLPIQHVPAYIKVQCAQLGIAIPSDFESKLVYLRAAYTAGKYRRFRKKVPQIVRGRLSQQIFLWR